MEKETKNVLNRQYTTVVIQYLNTKGQPKEYTLVNHIGYLHYGKLGVDSWYREYSNYDNLIYDLEKRYLPKEVSDRLYVRKGLFSKKKYIYESCPCGDERLNRKSFVKLIFDQRYKEAKDVTLKTVTQQLPVEELFLFAKDHCEGLRYYNKLEDYINNRIQEETDSLRQITETMMQSLGLDDTDKWPTM